MRFIRGPKGHPGDTVEVRFSDYGIVAGARVTVRYSYKDGYYPKEFRGQVETVYPAVFAVVRTTVGYRVTIHLSDLICSFVHVLFHGKPAAVVRKENRHAHQALVSASL